MLTVPIPLQYTDLSRGIASEEIKLIPTPAFFFYFASAGFKVYGTETASFIDWYLTIETANSCTELARNNKEKHKN
jgi:hypothetical protein